MFCLRFAALRDNIVERGKALGKSCPCIFFGSGEFGLAPLRFVGKQAIAFADTVIDRFRLCHQVAQLRIR